MRSISPANRSRIVNGFPARVVSRRPNRWSSRGAISVFFSGIRTPPVCAALSRLSSSTRNANAGPSATAISRNRIDVARTRRYQNDSQTRVGWISFVLAQAQSQDRSSPQPRHVQVAGCGGTARTSRSVLQARRLNKKRARPFSDRARLRRILTQNPQNPQKQIISACSASSALI